MQTLLDTTIVEPNGRQIINDNFDEHELRIDQMTGVTVLTDAATIAVDASLPARIFRVTLGGNRTMGLPSNATDGRMILFEIIQDATGSRTLAFHASYGFGSDITAFTASTAAGKVDYVGVVYSAALGKWLVIGVAKGYNA